MIGSAVEKGLERGAECHQYSQLEFAFAEA